VSLRSRAKGARYETELKTYLRGRYVCMRSSQFKLGGGSEPDILAVHHLARPLQIEAKNRRTMPARSHVAALEQAEATGPGLAIAVAKVARQPIEQAIVTMRFGALLELLDQVAGLERLVKQHAAQTARTDPE